MDLFVACFSKLFVQKRKEFKLWDDSDINVLLRQKSIESDFDDNKVFAIKVKDIEVNPEINLNVVEVLTKSDECLKVDTNCKSMYSYEDESKWFLPKCNRINAEKLLKGRKDGTFLVRTSDNLNGKYILSIVIRGHIKHIVIQKYEDGYSLQGGERHPTLYSLIMFYAQPFERNSVANDFYKNLNFPVFQ